MSNQYATSYYNKLANKQHKINIQPWEQKEIMTFVMKPKTKLNLQQKIYTPQDETTNRNNVLNMSYDYIKPKCYQQTLV